MSLNLALPHSADTEPPQIPLKCPYSSYTRAIGVTARSDREVSHTWGFLAGQHDARH